MDNLKEVTNLFQELLDDKTVKIDLNSNSENTEAWDSLTQIQLIFAIEKKYRIRFSAFDLEKLDNIKTILELINSKLAD